MRYALDDGYRSEPHGKNPYKMAMKEPVTVAGVPMLLDYAGLGDYQEVIASITLFESMYGAAKACFRDIHGDTVDRPEKEILDKLFDPEYFYNHAHSLISGAAGRIGNIEPRIGVYFRDGRKCNGLIVTLPYESGMYGEKQFVVDPVGGFAGIIEAPTDTYTIRRDLPINRKKENLPVDVEFVVA